MGVGTFRYLLCMEGAKQGEGHMFLSRTLPKRCAASTLYETLQYLREGFWQSRRCSGCVRSTCPCILCV